MLKTISKIKKKSLEGIAILACTSSLLFSSGCVTTSSQQGLGLLLGMSAPFSKDPQAAQSAAFLGRALVEADMADRSASKIEQKVYVQPEKQIQIENWRNKEWLITAKEYNQSADGYFHPNNIKDRRSVFNTEEDFYIIFCVLNEKGNKANVIIKNEKGEISDFKNYSFSHNANYGSIKFSPIEEPGFYNIKVNVGGRERFSDYIQIIPSENCNIVQPEKEED